MERKDMYHYLVGPGMNLNINTKGFFKDTSELDFVILEQHATLIHSRTTFPNGVIIENKVSNGIVEIWTSHRLIVSPTFEIVFDIEYPVVID